MVEITRARKPSILSALPPRANRIDGLLAGEEIAPGDACYVDRNVWVYRSIGAAADKGADVRGFATTKAKRGEAVILAFDVTIRYGEDLPPSEGLYLSATVPGGLADAPSPGGTMPVAFVVDATRIHVLQSSYRRGAGRAAGRAGD